ncbi:Uncharacterised protein [uncultured archaeon]|nr:Uncharacterised protein [uncultured archaeon]
MDSMTKILESFDSVTAINEHHLNNFRCSACQDSGMMKCDFCGGHGILESIDAPTTECNHCHGLGYMKCAHCQKILTEERDAYGPGGQYWDNGKMHPEHSKKEPKEHGEENELWTKDEMDYPDEDFYKKEVAGEKTNLTKLNNHDLTIEDRLEHHGLAESAAPGQEDWIKKNKQNFIDEYGKEKGLEVLYATAWKRHDKALGESKEMNECGENNPEGTMTVNSSYDSASDTKSLTVSATNQAAEELADILKLSNVQGENPNEIKTCPQCGVKFSGEQCPACHPVVATDVATCGTPLTNEAKVNEAQEYLVSAQKTKNWKEFPVYAKRKADDPSEFIITDERKDATHFENLADAKEAAAYIKQKADMFYPDYVAHHIQVEPIVEGLHPERTNKGLNGAAHGWQNEPNEQIAHWRAVIDDADGPNNPKNMFNPVKGSDNIMKVFANKKEPTLHEDLNGVDHLAKNLQEKFEHFVVEDHCKHANCARDKKCRKCGCCEKHCHCKMNEDAWDTSAAGIGKPSKSGPCDNFEGRMKPNGICWNCRHTYAEHQKKQGKMNESRDANECENCGAPVHGNEKLCADCRKNKGKSPKFRKKIVREYYHGEANVYDEILAKLQEKYPEVFDEYDLDTISDAIIDQEGYVTDVEQIDVHTDDDIENWAREVVNTLSENQDNLGESWGIK